MNPDELLKRVEVVKEKMNLPLTKEKISELEKESSNPVFWSDQENARKKKETHATATTDSQAVLCLQQIRGLRNTRKGTKEYSKAGHG